MSARAKAINTLDSAWRLYDAERMANERLLAENALLRQQRDELANVLRDFRDNWDCDGDAHKYGTPCRCCVARAALAKIEGK